ncbi:MAG: phosphatase PAP2 family protein [Draconibacterium sp.]|nr:phosphatase PAP2 family protein [Draconibacterium sp.]
MKTRLLCVFLCTIVTFSGSAQKDSISFVNQKKKLFIKKQILPLSLIAAGSLLNIGQVKNKIQDKIPNTSIHFDDYFQYVPIGEMYLFDAFGFEHQNTVFNQTKYLIISQLVSGSLVHLLKNTLNVKRPYGGNHSFPSGHTATAFVNATVLFHEFKDTEPLLAYSGFIFATATGMLRLTNNAHWLPDVLTSAGIGILTTNLVYYFKPFQGFQPFNKKKDITLTPAITGNSLGLLCRF